jgi:hypothetical protein
MSAKTAWGQMLARCYDPNNHKYKNYGARGIRVCDRWLCRRLFLEDMGERPEGMTLNRINNDGPYSPENCEWATQRQQNQNRTNNRLITFDGKTQFLTEWARHYGLNRTTLRKRLDKGWPVEAAITTPLNEVRQEFVQ